MSIFSRRFLVFSVVSALALVPSLAPVGPWISQASAVTLLTSTTAIVKPNSTNTATFIAIFGNLPRPTKGIELQLVGMTPTNPIGGFGSLSLEKDVHKECPTSSGNTGIDVKLQENFSSGKCYIVGPNLHEVAFYSGDGVSAADLGNELNFQFRPGSLTFEGLGPYEMKVREVGSPTLLHTITFSNAITPTKLGVVRQPSTTGQTGVSLGVQPQVEILDAQNVRVTDSTVLVTANIKTLPAGVTAQDVSISGNTRTASSGLATFSGLMINGPPGNYTLEFTTSGLTAVTSGTVALKLNQSPLSITTIDGTYLSPLSLSTSGGDSSGDVTYTVVNGTATGCSVSGSILTSASFGTCLVTATKASDTTYFAVSSSQTTVALRASRSISFQTTSFSIAYGNQATVIATPSAGVGDGGVSYSAGSSDACSVNSSGVVLVTKASGTCEITATVAQGTNYLAASTTTSVAVTTGTRPLTLAASGASVNFGTAYSTNPLATGLFSSDAVSGATYIYEGTGSTVYGPSTTMPTDAGTYKVTPSAATFSTGMIENYSITYQHGNIQISRVSRTLSFGGTTSATVSYGSTHTVTATPSAGDGAVTYSTASPDCAVNASTGVVTANSSTGTCTISASIAEGTNHLTANTTSSFTVTLAKKNITLKTADFEVTEGGDVVPATQVSVGSLVGSDAISSATFTYVGTGTTSYGPSTVAPTDIGTYDVTPSVPVFGTGSATNYTISFAAGTLTISAQPPAPAPSSGGVAAQPVAGPAIAGVTARGSENGRGSFLRVRLDKTPAAFEQLTVVVRLLDLKGELVEELRIPVSQGASMLEIPIDRPMGQFNAVAQISSSIAANAANNAATKLRPAPLQQSTIREATEERPARLLGKRLSRPVLFAAESAKLTPAIKRELRKAARAAKESGSRLAVTGFHALSGQGEAFEQSLAEKRALRVARFLRNQGLDNWILFDGLSGAEGQQFPGQPRRVEIRVLK
jgi:outer membrane protein OmpA-like peptidoglycan-associated protein